MDTKILQNKQSLLFLILGVTSYIIFILLARYCKPLTLANLLGCLAFIAYITTLAPSMFRAIFPNMRGNKILILLLKKRRDIGIISYILASNHALIMAVEKILTF
ncbi:hypothetical protein [Calothrix sp. 336/3]|uniref:hypothetical protein n=1 Tax=Calothrix sp. 336/3 TaxID=1337936 RepID=UPI00069ACFE5|nr:hypothetical protein [Calothrix sp. 336/3]